MSLTALLPSLDPLLVAIICAIFLFAGVVKGFLGIGLPAAAMGLLTLVIPPTEAISLLWLPILFTNIVQFGRAPERRSIATSYIWFAVPLAASIFLTSLFINDYPTLARSRPGWNSLRAPLPCLPMPRGVRAASIM